MKSPRLPVSCMLLLLILLSTCHRAAPREEATRTVKVDRLPGVAFVPSDASLSLRWPQFLLAEGTNSFLWGEGREIVRLERPEKGRFAAEPTARDLTRGLDKLISAAETSRGTLAVLDVRGRVATRRWASGQISTFETHLQNRLGNLAVTEERIFLLLQGEPEEGSAIVAYTFAGVEVGRWGTMPADSLIQARLQGGGIAACPDGSVFYSYINSPQILRLEFGQKPRVRSIGRPRASFRVISEGEIHEALRQGRQLRSVAPLVKLGLRASRIMALRCSDEGLLVRQVAHPNGRGAEVELWDPRTENWVGSIPIADGVLLDVKDRTLYLGALKEGQVFRLERIQFLLERSPLSNQATR